MSDSRFISTATNTIANSGEILKEVYADIAKPTAQNVGHALGTLSSTINVLLAPISWAVYGFNQIDNFVKSKLEEKLSSTPIEELKEPDPNIVIPAYEALRYTLDKEELKNMYINLIANSMKISTSNSVHPAFVEVIKQLSVFDAELLKKIFGNSVTTIPKIKIRLQKSKIESAGIDVCNIVIDPKYYSFSLYHDEYTVSLENLERLKIITIKDYTKLLIPNIYTDIENSIDIEYLSSQSKEFPHIEFIYGSISLTGFGKKLIETIFN